MSIPQQIHFVEKLEEDDSATKLFFRFINCNNNLNNETSKDINLLNELIDSKLVTRKWNVVNDNSRAKYNIGNEIIYKVEVLEFNIYDYKDAYILEEGNITVTAAPPTQVAF